MIISFSYIPLRILVTALKPDIVIVNDDSLEVIILELTCPWDANIARSHSFKSEKYAPPSCRPFSYPRGFILFDRSVSEGSGEERESFTAKTVLIKVLF